MTPSPREILESSSSFRPSLEKEKIVFERMVNRYYDMEFNTHIIGGFDSILYELTPLIGKRVRVTIEEIE